MALALSSFPVAEGFRKKIQRANVQVHEVVEEEPDQDKCQKCMNFCENAPFGQDKCKKMCGKLCGLMDEVEQGRQCGRALFAFKKTCGRKGDSCEACVEQGMSKLRHTHLQHSSEGCEP